MVGPAGFEPATYGSNQTAHHIDLEGFKKFLQANYSKRTTEDYLKTMKRFTKYHNTINKDTISEFLALFTNKANETFNRNFKAIRCYCKYKDIEYLLKGFVSKPRVRDLVIDDIRTQARPLDYDDFVKVIKSESDCELKTFWLLCQQSRPVEAMSLTWNDIDFKNDVYSTTKVHNGITKHSWGGFLTQEMKELLLTLKERNTERPFAHAHRYYVRAFRNKCEEILGRPYHLKDIRSAFADFLLTKTNNPILANVLQGRSAKSIDVLLKHYARPKLSTLKEQWQSAMNND